MILEPENQNVVAPERRKLDDTDKWLRDRILKLQTTGYLAFVGLASVMIASEGEFASACACFREAGGSNKSCHVAVGLLVFVPVFLIFWALEIWRCQKALGAPHVTFATPRSTSLRIAITAGLIMGLVILSVLVDVKNAGGR